MLKACTLFYRKPGMDPVEFQTYWRTDHPGFVLRMPQVRRYIQNHPRLDLGQNLPYDGLVELWVDDIGALKDLGKSKEYERVIEDETAFVDRSRLDLVLTDEHVVLDGAPAPDGVKLVVLLKRKPGMSPAEFQDYWLNRHAPLVGTPPGLRRYAQSHAKLAGYRDGRSPAWDGIGEMWFDSLEAMKASRHAPGQDKVKADAANFVDLGAMKSFVVTENIVRA